MTVGDGKTIPDPAYENTKEQVLRLRYREKFKLSSEQLAREPIEEYNFALAVWEAEAKRDKLEAARQEAKARNNGND